MFNLRDKTIAVGAIKAVAAILPTLRADIRKVKRNINIGISLIRPLQRARTRSETIANVPLDSAMAKSNVTETSVKKSLVGNLETISSEDKPSAKTPKTRAAKREANPRWNSLFQAAALTKIIKTISPRIAIGSPNI